MYEPRESKLFIKTRFARRGIYWLPNLFTIIALFAGFYAIVQAMSGRFEQAAIAIFVAMVFDGLDGRVARPPRSGSRASIPRSMSPTSGFSRACQARPPRASSPDWSGRSTSTR